MKYYLRYFGNNRKIIKTLFHTNIFNFVLHLVKYRRLLYYMLFINIFNERTMIDIAVTVQKTKFRYKLHNLPIRKYIIITNYIYIFYLYIFRCSGDLGKSTDLD